MNDSAPALFKKKLGVSGAGRRSVLMVFANEDGGGWERLGKDDGCDCGGSQFMQ
jgi:hypothetical protein